MVRLKELQLNQPIPVTYDISSGGIKRETSTNTILANSGDGSIIGLMRRVFLPEGFPDSVSSDYLEYQAWDTLQAFASSVSGSLATAAVLGGLGVGDSQATPLAATLTWIMKDGAGMIGRIVFAAYCGTSLDFDCKRWRMFADIMNDCVMCVELCAPILPRPLVLPTLCATGLGRSLVGVAGGATKAAVAQHQALRNNMADLSAKDGSQETLVNLIALCVNLTILPMISDTHFLPFLLFLCLAALHIYSNYKAVSCLVMTTLNSSRLNILLEKYFLSQIVDEPRTVNYLEPVMRPTKPVINIKMGVSLKNLDSKDADIIERMINNEDPYCIVTKGNTYLVLVTNIATIRDIYKAYIECYLDSMSKSLDKDLLLSEMSRKGWNLDCLSLNSYGCTVEIPR